MGPAGSPRGGCLGRNDSDDKEAQCPPTSPIRAHHVVGDHLLQAVSKPLQTFLGVGGGDPYLNGTAMPPVSAPPPTSHRVAPSPAQHKHPPAPRAGAPSRGAACLCLPLPRGQRSPAPHRYNSVAWQCWDRSRMPHEESVGGDVGACLPRSCCYITSPAADRGEDGRGTLTPVGPALTTTKARPHRLGPCQNANSAHGLSVPRTQLGNPRQEKEGHCLPILLSPTWCWGNSLALTRPWL